MTGRPPNPNRITRLTLSLPESAQKILDQLTAYGLYGASRGEVLRRLALDAMRQTVDQGLVKITKNVERDLYTDKSLIRQTRSPLKKGKSRTRFVIRNRALVIRYSKLVIFALQEALEYDPARHHNQPPPDLRIDDPDYLQEMRILVSELQRLNDLLEATVRRRQESSRAVLSFAKHADNFLGKYASALGKGAGYLTIGMIASLLYQAGVGPDLVAKILGYASISK
jgi:hypothetical protein